MGTKAKQRGGGRSTLDTVPATAQAKAVELAARTAAKAGTSPKGSKADTKKAASKQAAAGTGPKSKADAAAEAEQKKAVHTSASAAIRKSAEFSSVKGWLQDLLSSHDPLIDTQVEEYMAFWVQRKLLAADVEERGVLVMDERGRLSENRNVSLGIQISKQMQVLLQQLGVYAKRAKATESDDPGKDEEL